MVTTLVVPAAERQLAITMAAWNAFAQSGARRESAHARRVAALGESLEAALAGVEALQKKLGEVHASHDEMKACQRLGAEVRPLMQELRAASDRLETLVDDELWPLPKYREMLFVK